MAERKKQSFLHGALILSVAAILTKIIGALFFKIPLQKINTTAYGYFDTAFWVYTPLYTVSTAGFPIAVSRMVSKSITLKRFRDVSVIHKVASRVFLVTGSVGTFLMIILAFIYPRYIHMTNMQLTMLIMAPSILFCCMVSSYRGVYEGSRNMYPTAISQIVEAVGKLLFGISLAAGALKYGLAQYANGQPVYGHAAASADEAVQYSLPYIAAGGMVGVTAGSFLALAYIMIRYRLKGNGITKEELAGSPKAQSSHAIFRALLAFAIPVALGTLASQLTTIIDAVSLQRSLAVVIDRHGDILRQIYAKEIAATGTTDLNGFLSGFRGTAMTWVNLVPNITLSLGTSAIPVITSAWTLNDRRQLKKMVSLVLRITLLIALPSGAGMAVLARPIMKIIYDQSTSEIAGPQLEVLGIAVIFICLVAPVNAMLQAMGRADIPAKIVLVGGAVKLLLNTSLVLNPYINIMGSAWSTLACYVVMVALSLIALRKVVGVRLHWRSIFIKPLFATVLCCTAAWTSYKLLDLMLNEKIATLFAIILASFVYIWVMLLIKAIKREDIVMLPKGQKIAEVLEKHNWIE